MLARIVQVKVQTTPGWAKGLSDGLPKFVAENGVAGYAGPSALQALFVMHLLAC